MLALCAAQQAQLDQNSRQQSLVSRQEFREVLDHELASKADVQDVSNAITEVILSVDCRKDIDQLKKLVNMRSEEKETSMSKKMLKMFDGFKQETQNLLKAVQSQEDLISKTATRIEEVRKEQNKKVVTLVNEIEKLQASLDRKCSLDDFTARLDSKVDKTALAHALSQRPTRQEIEPVLNNKAEIHEVQSMLQTLEQKFEDEFYALNEAISRRASSEDLQYCRKEASTKADKDELDDLRSEVTERLQSISQRLTEKDRYVNAVLEETEAKVAEKLSDLRAKVS